MSSYLAKLRFKIQNEMVNGLMVNRLFQIVNKPYIRGLAYALSCGYYAGLSLHKSLYKMGLLQIKDAPCKVISIGNITVGGTGKTPFALFLSDLLKKEGKRVAVVVRGYKSRDKGILISDGQDILQGVFQAGDEGYILARRLKGIPILKAKRRYIAINYAFNHFGADVIVLDDAFQYWALKRDVDIVLLNAEEPFGNGHLLPRGKLREPISALKRADAIVLSRTDDRAAGGWRAHLKEIFDIPIFTADYILESLVSIENKSYPLDYLKDTPVLAFCGISRPERFRYTCSKLGVEIKRFIVYPDHYYYRQKDIDFLKKEAEASGLKCLLTTEKDIVKIADCRLPIFYPKISIEIKDKQGFYRWLKKKLES